MSPLIHLASQRAVTLLASLSGLKKKWQDPRGLVHQCEAVAICDHPLNCQSGGLRRLVSTFSQVGSVPTSAKGSVGDKWISNSLWKRHSYGKPICFLIFLHGLVCPNCMNLSRVTFMATAFMSMTTRSSDLDGQKSGTSVQKGGHTLIPPSGQNGPAHPEAFGSTPSCSPSQSLARKSNHHEMQYCLEFRWSLPKMREQHHLYYMHGRYQL